MWYRDMISKRIIDKIDRQIALNPTNHYTIQTYPRQELDYHENKDTIEK